MKSNRSYEEGVQLAIKIWRHFETGEEQNEAIRLLNSIFEEESKDWLARFEMLPGQANSIEKLREEHELFNQSLKEAQERFQQEYNNIEDKTKPDIPDKAEEGTLL